MKIRQKILLWLIGSSCISLSIFMAFVTHETNEFYEETLIEEIQSQVKGIESLLNLDTLPISYLKSLVHDQFNCSSKILRVSVSHLLS